MSSETPRTLDRPMISTSPLDTTATINAADAPSLLASLPGVPFVLQPQKPEAIEEVEWKLEWQKRGGRAGADWVVRVGIMVADASGMVVPMHVYLRQVLTEIAEQLSAPTAQLRSADALRRAVCAHVDAANDVCEHPVEMPDHFPALLTHALLWGNFTDATVALIEVALSGEGETLSIDAHTLGIVSPRAYARKRAPIPEAEPCSDYYAVAAPERADRGWNTMTEDGLLAPTALWSLQNAFNCQFRGPAALGKEKMRAWCASVTQRFLTALEHTDGLSKEQFFAAIGSQ